FRQDVYANASLVPAGTRLVVISADAREVHRSPADLGVVGTPSTICAAVAGRVASRPRALRSVRPAVPALASRPGASLRTQDVFAELINRMPADAVVVEETPSSNDLLRS